MDETAIEISLTPQMVIAIIRSQDLWPIDKKAPEGFFDVQEKIGQALAENPAARAAVKSIEDSAS
ncbi:MULTISPECIES: hypothetical protein [unclassified Bradyrhizobium]|uniref:hypothetical protein n=1 Tax=unclassified Bradyrhizobium TaxID=2631580 RepID=UPI00247A27BE|nr:MULTISPECIES: hypothetical protein [unclassified Bradyrhizobium]WGS23377.1 hypothetical protein MTX22_18180 [Bradyrhizobium sp. ISRA463]WGS30390.1 hypothetical protein MTX19_15905 [Bradyrhizobium sp. ISRA464]